MSTPASAATTAERLAEFTRDCASVIAETIFLSGPAAAAAPDIAASIRASLMSLLDRCPAVGALPEGERAELVETVIDATLEICAFRLGDLVLRAVKVEGRA